MSDQTALAAAWRGHARRTALKANLGWWVEKSAPAIVIAGVAGFAAILWMRSRGVEVGIAKMWPWIAGGLAGAMVVGWMMAREKRITARQAMVRLESELRLHNALTAAEAGAGEWPAAPPRIADGWRWRWQWIAGPYAAAALCVALAWWIPISQEAQAALAPVEPQSWQQMDEWLEKLKEEKVITPEEKQEQAKKIGDLRDQPKEKWFSHESLNASDTLKEQLSKDIQNLGQNLANAERSLNALQNYEAMLSPAAKDQLLKEFDEALDGMKGSALELDPNLLKELAQIDPKNLKSLSKEQLDQLREAMKKKGGA